jgi:hypothetical protein
MTTSPYLLIFLCKLYHTPMVLSNLAGPPASKAGTSPATTLHLNCTTLYGILQMGLEEITSYGRGGVREQQEQQRQLQQCSYWLLFD